MSWQLYGYPDPPAKDNPFVVFWGIVLWFALALVFCLLAVLPVRPPRGAR